MDISIITSHGMIERHGFVDLGLSVKWASCNIGSSSPIDPGSYFAWGETTPKHIFTWKNYRFCDFKENGDILLSKYFDDAKESDETIRRPLIQWRNIASGMMLNDLVLTHLDHRTRLERNDDAAHSNWGGSWRMPTIEEMDELIYECSWDPCNIGGKRGCLGRSQKNGASIFLPYTGWWGESYHDEEVACLWSSSLRPDFSFEAYGIEFGWFDYLHDYHIKWAICSRHFGLPIRPVSSE